MSSDENDEIELVIENQSLKCSRSTLIHNSDYFKVMLEGNFKERNATELKIEGIVFETMKPLLLMLWDDTYIIEFEEMLAVLKTACILQFVEIRDKLVIHLTEILKPDNCVKIWFTAEFLDLSPLYLKAKNLALIEFNVIKDSDCLEELDLVQLHSYLANVYLKCKSEMDVFQVCMRWVFENEKNREQDEPLIISLFSCIDFTKLSDEDIKEIMLFPNICDKKSILDVLNCLLVKRRNSDISEFSESTVKEVEKLFNGSLRASDYNCDIFILARTCNRPISKEICIFSDDFDRKRRYETLTMENFVEEFSASVLSVDDELQFHRYVDIPKEKIDGFEGFQMLGYKEQLFLFGGENHLGSGSWNRNLWVYDTIRERWYIKSRVPHGRRHFESCICGDNLFIVGGTGSFRILQDNMFFYNYKTNTWSNLITLPDAGWGLKCCNYKDKLLLLNFANSCAYLFVEDNSSFVKLNIVGLDTVVALEKFSLFSYNDRIIIKGSSIIEMKVLDKKLCVVSQKNLKRIHSDSVESVVCKGKVYTLYKNNLAQTIEFEIYCLKTYKTLSIFERPLLEPHLINRQMYYFNKNALLFTLKHHNKLTKSDFVNNL